jgi:plastocyanin
MRIIIIIIRAMWGTTSRNSQSIAVVAFAAGFAAFAAAAPVARADDTPTQINFINGHFEPASVKIAANTPIKLKVRNDGKSTIEFESFELNRERVVQPGQTITVQLPKLDPGQYHFFDDFHHDVPQGTITAQ